jgi:hypothetical protein
MLLCVNVIRDYCARFHGSSCKLQCFVKRASDRRRTLGMSGASQRQHKEHHEAAAEHHAKAAAHHRKAAEHYEEGDHEKGGHHAHLAHAHGLHATHAANEAAKHHADKHDGHDEEDEE